MEIFTKTKAVKLKSHIDKYLVAHDDQEHTRQSKNGSSRKSHWIVELVEGNEQMIRLKSCHGKYLTASNEAFLLGMTGKKVVQTIPEYMEDLRVLWKPIKDGFLVKLMAFGGTYLRANGGTPPWRNSVTHDGSYTGSRHNWILWDVEGVMIGEDEVVRDYWSMVSSFSSVSGELSGLDIGSPVVAEYSVQSPKVLLKKVSFSSSYYCFVI
ncbi:hypothetical protein LIER_42363 [Lithospermum erythrorhizon]|uniref:DUF569 domain-containing protein n=1 Tax=Lithospermum erythrorhizon TaxID=34254 RepID=A0AAV3RNL2_LITER